MDAKDVITESGFDADSMFSILANAIDIDRAAKSISLVRLSNTTQMNFGTGQDYSFGHQYEFDFSDETLVWDVDTTCQGLITIEGGSLVLQPQNAYIIISSSVLHSNCDNTIYHYWYNSTDNSSFSNVGVRRHVFNQPRDSTGALLPTAQGDIQINSLIFYTDTLYNPKYWRPKLMVGLCDSNFAASADVNVKRKEYTVIGFPKWAL